MEEIILKAIGDPRRYQFLSMLAERSYCVGALAHLTGLSESAVSQHLKVLREADLIYGVKLGYYTHYRLNRERLAELARNLEALARTERKPCNGQFNGCSEAVYVRCRTQANRGETPEPEVRPVNEGKEGEQK